MREKSKYFQFVSDWIVTYELKNSKLITLKDQFDFLNEFLQRTTTNIFEKIILLDEIYDDIF